MVPIGFVTQGVGTKKRKTAVMTSYNKSTKEGDWSSVHFFIFVGHNLKKPTDSDAKEGIRDITCMS